MMPLSAGEIRNALTILRSIDRHHLDEVGFAATDSDWALFRKDPASFYLRAGSAAREAITQIINARMPAHG